MLRLPLAATALVVTLATSQAGPLQVLRATPSSPADPLSEITVTFDRPVAGGLEATVDAASVFAIEPAVEGLVEWRDPVTLRFVPASPLEPGRSYRIRIAGSLEAMDGSRLEGAYRYGFQVAAARILDGSPVGPRLAPQFLDPQPVLSLLLSSGTDVEALARSIRIRVGAPCGGGEIGVRPLGGLRRIGPDDPRVFLYRGLRGPSGDSARDIRRVVDLTPLAPLPETCRDTLLVPEVADGSGGTYRWPLTVRGPFRLAGVVCAQGRSCPTGPVHLRFTTPVSGAEVLRHVRVEPSIPFTVDDTTALRADWFLPAPLTPRSRYGVVVEPGMRDAFDQPIGGVLTHTLRTTGYAPMVTYEYGRMVVEGAGLRTLPIQHVNVDTLVVSTIPVPDTLEAAFLAQGWGWGDQWNLARALIRVDTLVVRGGEDARRITGVRMGDGGRAAASGGSLLAVKVSSPQMDTTARKNSPIALVQVTDLALTARVGMEEGKVWVTGVHDGTPRPGAAVTLHDYKGRVLATARSDERGIATLGDFRNHGDPCQDWRCSSFEGYVSATLGEDRAVVGISTYDPDLSPWRFDVYAAWGETRAQTAAAVFTERGIYRPGEPVHAKAILRRGALGALVAPRGDSVRWIFHDRESGVLRDTVATLGAFGTAEERFTLPEGLPLGSYQVEVQMQRDGEWRPAASAWYRVAEYRPPEFLVEVEGEGRPRVAGDSTSFRVSARYLFGAPMAQAPVRWTVQRRSASPWEVEIPGAEAYQVGVAWNWWEERDSPGQALLLAGSDTLGPEGSWEHRVALDAPPGGRPARVTFTATVTDANRQIGASSASVLVHPAAFYLGVRPLGESYFWTAGTLVGVEVLALEPGGERVGGVAVQGTVVRREWHRVRRERGGMVQEVGGWVADTVATCTLETGAEPATCGFTPPAGGSYTVLFRAADPEGRSVETSLNRWATGPEWVPWNDESRFKMDVIPDRTRYAPGDTATILFAAPFTDAEAWITVERERVLEERRVRIEAGATTLRLPITEAFAPNVFVGIVVVRGRSAEPGPLDDPGRPTLRVGYTELRVTPEVKRLDVEVRPLSPEYRPGDTASVELRVLDSGRRGVRSEVTLWAVDEGVLSLTGYETPDPIDLLYPPRGLGMRLASNLVAVAPQVPEGEKGSREPGGGGGGDLSGILRSRFRSTAFFLGSVETDESGFVVASAKLPDNVTTFRVMAVAVTAGDRYGSGESEILVTRPLLARPALPRFVREGDRFRAGVVVNSRLGGTPRVEVKTRVDGIEVEGRRSRTQRLEEGRGADVRFDFRALAGDSARFRFDASAGREADAVAVAVPVRPNYHPLASTVAGRVLDTATVEIELQEDVDPRRSRVEVTAGISPLAAIRNAWNRLALYPYDCTEQVASGLLPLAALLRAEEGRPGEGLLPAGAREEAESAVRVLASRQRPDGAIGYWGGSDWSTPWLSAYAGRALVEAREAGIPVADTVLGGVAGYLARALQNPRSFSESSPVSGLWQGDPAGRLGEQVAAADFLRRMGRPDPAAENTLAGQVSRMRLEDRLLFGHLMARRGETAVAGAILEAAERSVRVEGRTAVLPDSAGRSFYFASRVRPAARLLDLLLELEPASALVGPLVATLVEQGRVDSRRGWNTQDYGSAIPALLRFQQVQEENPPTEVRVRIGRRTVLEARTGEGMVAEAQASLQGLLEGARGDRPPRVTISVDAEGGAPVYFFVTVHETPRDVQLTPMDRGIQVERWYESTATGRPIVEAAEGELVRVRLRVTVPAQRTFVVLDDPLPAGLEPVDLSLRTLSPFGATVPPPEMLEEQTGWYYGSWDSGMWSAFDHKELRDDRVVYAATVLWPGTYSATYLARATASGTFLYPPAHAEEMYNPGVNGRTGGGTFTVKEAGR